MSVQRIRERPMAPADTRTGGDPIVWRGLTAAEVRQQYDMRAAVPDGERFTKRRVARSVPIRAKHLGARDLRYGTGPRQTLDIYDAAGERPDAATNGPIVMFFHGGAWRYQSKEGFAFMAPPLTATGATVVLPGFDLHPAVTVPQMMEQAREAIAWVVRKLNPEGTRRLVVAGHSSGAQLAAMALAWNFETVGLRYSPVDSALLISGSYDMEPHRHHPRYADLGLDEDMVLAISPASNPPLDSLMPLVLAVGADETPGYVRQTLAFRDKCVSRGHPVLVLQSPGDHHYSVVEQLAEPDHRMTRALIGLAHDGPFES